MVTLHKRLILGILCVLCTFSIMAQRNETLLPDIHTLQVENLSREWDMPIVRLGSNNQLLISFDHLTDEYHRFVYKIVHLDAQFRPSTSLFERDFVETNAETVPIEDYEESMNTITHYVHYQFVFPNRDIRPKISGNYRLDILLDEDDEPIPVAHVYFYVLDEQINTGLTVTTNTDIDWNQSHQQVEMRLTSSQLEVRDPESELYVYVLQNRRWDNAAINPLPTYINGRELIWHNTRPLIFPAANEYRRFEMLSTRYAGIGLERMQWFDPYYHASLFPDDPRPNYLYEQDINGRFVVRTEDNQDSASESEYVWVHFSLNCDHIEGYDIYVNGDFTDNRFAPAYRLHYNFGHQAYEGRVYLKTGYYNYQYLAVKKGGTTGQTLPIEGDYYQTENEYDALIYYKQPGSRYWQLVGRGHTDFKLTH